MNSYISLHIMNMLASSLICDADECLSFIIVFLNLLTIFFLVFSSYIKINGKVLRIFGYFWSAFIMVMSVIVLAIHTCIFTLGGIIFTAMAMAAVLSLVLESKKKEGNTGEYEVKKKNVGCYVIFPTTDDAFVFGLHNRSNQLLAMSKYKYKTVEEAKEAIMLARSSGESASFEDLTKSWVIDAKHPKFRMYLKNNKYLFELAISEECSILRSKPITDASLCLKMVKEARKCVSNNNLYFATAQADIMKGERYNFYKEGAKEKEVDSSLMDDEVIEGTPLSRSFEPLRQSFGNIIDKMKKKTPKAEAKDEAAPEIQDEVAEAPKPKKKSSSKAPKALEAQEDSNKSEGIF